MATATAERGIQIEATITGDVGGQVAIGEHIAQYRVESGGTLIVGAPAGQQAACRPRPLPISLGGRRPPDLLGRDSEIEGAARALEGGDTVEFHGRPGIGKTCILKYLGHRPPPATAAHGVVYHDATGESVDDIVAILHEAFFEVPDAVKPSEADIRHDLRDVAAFVVLDEVQVPRGGLDEILDFLPAATFLVASNRRTLWGAGRSVALGGLPGDAAVELLERELGRNLDAEEEAAARAIVQGVGAEPLRVLEAAALLAQMGSELSELAGRLAAGSTPEEVAALLLESLSDDERAVLAVLTALAGATMTAAQLADLTGVEDVDEVIESLLRMRLIKANSPRYNVTDAPTLERVVDHAPWHQPLISHFSGWVERNQDRPHVIVQERQAVLSVLARASERAAWADLLRLGRSAEHAFFVRKQWGGWKEVLDHQLAAAQNLGDRAATGWAHHQLGSRALCLGHRGAALSHLTQALAIRELIGDEVGAATTRHNLSLLAEGHRRRSEAAKSAPAAVVASAPLAGLPLLAIFLGVAVLAIFVTGAARLASPDRDPDRSGAIPAGSVLFPLRADPERLDMGEAPTGGAGRVRGVSVSNSGTGPVRIGSVAVAGSLGTYRIESEGCTAGPLPPAAVCRIEVRFTPAAAGASRAEVVVDAGADGELRIPVEGSGAGPSPPGSAQAGIEPASVSFGARAVSAAPAVRTLSVVNAGEAALRVVSVEVEGTDRGDFGVLRDGCTGASLAAGARCRIEVSFVAGAPGARRAVLAATTEVPGTRPTATLSGVGTGPNGNGGGVVIDPLADRELTYGSQVNIVVTGSYPGRAGVALTFSATRLPAGLALRQTGATRAEISGRVLDRPGRYEAQVTLRAADGSESSRPVAITVVPATLQLTWLQQLVDVTTAPITAVAVVTQTGATGADLADAPFVFQVTNMLTRATTPVPATITSDGRVTLEIRPGQLEAGLYTIRAQLDPANPNYRTAGPPPVALALNTDALGATVYTLSDLLSGTNL